MAVVTKTLRSSGGDYSLMSTWESTEQTNLVTATDSHVLECYDDWPTGLVDNLTIDGWTTSATYDITVKAVAGAEASWTGSAIDGFFMKNVSASGVDVLTITDNNTNVIGIGAQQDQALGCFFINSSSDNNYFSKCIGRSIYTGDSNNRIFRHNNMPTLIRFHNCLAISDGPTTTAAFNYGFYIQSSGAGAGNELLNCTSVCTTASTVFAGVRMGNNNTGFGWTVKNTVAYSSNGGGYVVSGIGSFASVTASTNAGNDTSAPGTSSVDNITSAAFVDYAGGDYTPAGGGVLQGAGTDLSGTFTDSITGSTRNFWDIGALKVTDYIWTLKSTLGDFALMATWESTNQRDLVALGETETLECYDDWPSGLVDTTSISGWTTDSAYYVTVRAAAGEGHGGDTSTGFLLKNNNAINARTINISIPYTRFEDIRVTHDNIAGSGTNKACMNVSSSADYSQVTRCIFSMRSTATANGIVYHGSSCIGFKFINNLVRNTGTGTARCMRIGSTANNCEYLNNTFIHENGNTSLLHSTDSTLHGSSKIQNNMAYRSGSTSNPYGIGTGGTQTNNASSGTTTLGTGGVTDVASTDFVDYAGGDYHPAAGGALAGAGTDLSADFTDDITGATR